MKTLIIPHNTDYKKELIDLNKVVDEFDNTFLLKDCSVPSIEYELERNEYSHIWAMSLGALNLVSIFRDKLLDIDVDTITLSSFFIDDKFIIIPPKVKNVNFIFGENDYVAEYEGDDIKYIYSSEDYTEIMIENLILNKNTQVSKNIIEGCGHFLNERKSIKEGIDFANSKYKHL